jgi:uncharacterized protein (TIGR03000 family)
MKRALLIILLAILGLSTATTPVRAQAGTGYYGGLNYRQYYSYGRDYWPGWYGGIGLYWTRPYPAYAPAGPLVGAPAGYNGTALYNAIPSEFFAKPVTVDVRVPAEADLWIEGMKTKQNGAERKFVSPPLQPGTPYTYEFRARWKENGKDVTRTITLDVAAGGKHEVDFLNPPKNPSRVEDFSSSTKAPAKALRPAGRIQEFAPAK